MDRIGDSSDDGEGQEEGNGREEQSLAAGIGKVLAVDRASRPERDGGWRLPDPDPPAALRVRPLPPLVLLQHRTMGDDHAAGGDVMLHRVISALLGTVMALAGVVASGYAEMAIEDVRRSELPLSSGLLGILFCGGLVAASFYMAFRFLRFAFARRST